jgi:hypothetical protein
MKNELLINESRFKEINDFLTKDSNLVTENLIKICEKYGGIEEINKKYKYSSKLETKLEKLKESKSPYLEDLNWLIEKRDSNAFISMEDYKKKILGENYGKISFKNENSVTLEISSLQYFPWILGQTKKVIENGELMPGRFIRVRNMKEQESDNGDIIAVSAAMDIVGATWVETLDTKGTDGANVHLGGPETITGYFGGPGQPNDYALKWVDEFLYYYTNYGIKQVLNVNPGTVLLSYMLHKMGVDIEFKISVFMGNDNPYSVLWTLMTAKMFSRDDGTTPLIGFNFSNSVNNETIRLASEIRKSLGFENVVRFEHHITETYKHIVRQPYDKLDELLEISQTVKNISAKHEGGICDIDAKRDHPSDILDYFRTKEEIISSGDMEHLEQNYLDKHDALNRTAENLIQQGIPVVAAWNLHK